MELPETSYRYYPKGKIEYFYEFITKGILYFAFPNEFKANDAYDCRTYSLITSKDIESDYKLLSSYWKQANYPNMPDDDKESLFNQRVVSYGGKNQFVIKTIEDLNIDCKDTWDDNRFGILCLTQNRNRIEMWKDKKYGSNYKGCCVELYLSKMLSYLKSKQVSKAREHEVKTICNYVNYVELGPKYNIKEYFNCQGEMLFLKLKSKYTYEDEIRIVIPECINQKIDFPIEVINKVIIGKYMIKADFKRIHNICKSNNIKLEVIAE
jgi:hypothetical protein